MVRALIIFTISAAMFGFFAQQILAGGRKPRAPLRPDLCALQTVAIAGSPEAAAAATARNKKGVTVELLTWLKLADSPEQADATLTFAETRWEGADGGEDTAVSGYLQRRGSTEIVWSITVGQNGPTDSIEFQTWRVLSALRLDAGCAKRK